MNSDVDVVIVGAGPAGLSAARVLSESDIDYLLLSREKSPGDSKACGGFVTRRTFDEFGILSFSGCHEVRSVRMKFPGMNIARVDFDTARGYNVARDAFGERLLSLVGAHEDHVRMNTEITGLRREDKHWLVRYRDPSGIAELSCKLVIDCSGANPISVKMGYVRKRLPPESMGYAVQYYFRTKRPTDLFGGVNDFYYGSEFSPHGYAWVFPRGRETVVGTGGLVANVRNSEKRLTDYLDYMVNETEPARTELASAEIFKRDAAMLPLAGVVRPSFDEGIMLAGDAAGHCSPITGEGIYYSMVGGKLAGETAIDAIKRNDLSKKQLGRYEKKWIGAIGSDLKWGLWLQKRLIREGSSNLGPSLLRSERNLRVIAEMLLGTRSVRSAMLKIAPSYIRAKL